MPKLLPLLLTITLLLPTISSGATTTASTTEAIAQLQQQLTKITELLTSLTRLLSSLKQYDQQYGTNRYNQFMNQPFPSSQGSGGFGGSSQQPQTFGNMLSGLLSSLARSLGGQQGSTGFGFPPGMQNPGSLVPPPSVVAPNNPAGAYFQSVGDPTAAGFGGLDIPKDISQACFQSKKNERLKLEGTDGVSEPGIYKFPRGTAYSPRSKEGGPNDRGGCPIKTLDEFLARRSLYVTVAIHPEWYEKIPFGTIIRIDELEKSYNNGQVIWFVATDTGVRSAGIIDIAVSDPADQEDPRINRPLTIIVPEEQKI